MMAARLASALMATLAAAGLAGGGLTACARPPEPRSAAAQGKVMPSVSAQSFTTGFSMMRRLKALSRLGTGKIGVLLPDTTTSPRYTEFDAPYLARALQQAGLSRSQVIITNAQGSDATQQAQAESDMTQGATVLLLDPIDSGVGASIESAAASMGVKVIDYDRMTLGGTRAYYVSFDNVAVGALMAHGLVNCIRAWHVAVAAAVIGGTSLFGGRGKPLDGVLGGIVIAAIYNGIYLLGMSAAAQDLIFALVLLAAVSADVLARRGQASRRA